MDRITFYKLNTRTYSKVYSSGRWVDGIMMKKLQYKLQNYLKVNHVILTNNGTSSLLAAYWVLKNSFNEISVDPYTFPATYQSARVLNYKIHFINSQLGNTVKGYKNKLNIVTHLFGQPNQTAINLKGKPFIEDACQSFGSEIKGKKVGTIGLFGCYSFYPTKSLHTCGHGGALVTNDNDLFTQANKFVNCGRENNQMTEDIALNLRMDEIKAEFLLNELKTYENKLNIQIEIANQYRCYIPKESQPFIEHNPSDRHIYSIFNLLVKNRDAFRKFMDKKHIDTQIYYGDEILPSNERKKYQKLTSSIVAIPCRWNLTKKEVNHISNTLKEWFV